MKPTINTNNKFIGIFYITILLVFVFVSMFIASSKNGTEHKVFFEGEELSVFIADTPSLQERGLGGRKKLLENEGMLFVFENSARIPFWMKDMLFPIDIIWFDANQKVVDMWEDAQPNSYPEVRAPQKDARYVLEVPAGFVRIHGVKTGDVFVLAQ